MGTRISLHSRSNTSGEHIRFVKRLEGLKKRAADAGLRIRVDEDDFMVFSKPRTIARALFEDEQDIFIVSSNNIDKLEAFIEGFALMAKAMDVYAGIDYDHVSKQIAMRKTMEALAAKPEDEYEDD